MPRRVLIRGGSLAATVAEPRSFCVAVVLLAVAAASCVSSRELPFEEDAGAHEPATDAAPPDAPAPLDARVVLDAGIHDAEIVDAEAGAVRRPAAEGEPIRIRSPGRLISVHDMDGNEFETARDELETDWFDGIALTLEEESLLTILDIPPGADIRADSWDVPLDWTPVQGLQFELPEYPGADRYRYRTGCGSGAVEPGATMQVDLMACCLVDGAAELYVTAVTRGEVLAYVNVRDIAVGGSAEDRVELGTLQWQAPPTDWPWVDVFGLVPGASASLRVVGVRNRGALVATGLHIVALGGTDFHRTFDFVGSVGTDWTLAFGYARDHDTGDYAVEAFNRAHFGYPFPSGETLFGADLLLPPRLDVDLQRKPELRWSLPDGSEGLTRTVVTTGWPSFVARAGWAVVMSPERTSLDLGVLPEARRPGPIERMPEFTVSIEERSWDGPWPAALDDMPVGVRTVMDPQRRHRVSRVHWDDPSTAHMVLLDGRPWYEAYATLNCYHPGLRDER